MRTLQFLLLILVLLIPATGCGAIHVDSPAPAPRALSGEDHQPSQGRGITPNHLGYLDQSTVLVEVERFVAAVDLTVEHPEIDEPFTLAKMIAHGLEQEPPRQITASQGELIVWGWNEARQEDKSLVIFGGKGKVELVAFSHAIPSLRNLRGRVPPEAIETHVARLNADATYMNPPFINIYVDDSGSTVRLYALSRLWVQAAVLGFNADCSELGQEALCAIARRFQPTIRVFSIACLRQSRGADECLTPTPVWKQPEDLSVEAFVQ